MTRRGANLANVTVISGIVTHDPIEMRRGKADTVRRVALPVDLGHIEYQLRLRPETRLVVIDSLSDFCQTDKQFRETVRGLHAIAERCNVAVVATARPKNDKRARSKLTPSADRRSEGVRCVLNVLVDPHDRSQRYLAPARMNFCDEPKWLPFRIGDGRVEWGEELATTPVYQRNSPAELEKRTLLHEAMDCLAGTLADGDLAAEKALQQVMACGFSKATIIRARRELGVRSIRKGFGPDGSWIWTLKKAGESMTAENGNANGQANGVGENEHAENGQGRPTADGRRPGRVRFRQLAPRAGSRIAELHQVPGDRRDGRAVAQWKAGEERQGVEERQTEAAVIGFVVKCASMEDGVARRAQSPTPAAQLKCVTRRFAVSERILTPV